MIIEQGRDEVPVIPDQSSNKHKTMIGNQAGNSLVREKKYIT